MPNQSPLRRASRAVTISLAVGGISVLSAPAASASEFNPVPVVTHSFVCDGGSNGGGQVNFVLTNIGLSTAHIHVQWTVSNGGGQYDVSTSQLNPQPFSHPIVEDQTVSFVITNTDSGGAGIAAFSQLANCLADPTTTTAAPTTTLESTTTLASVGVRPPARVLPSTGGSDSWTMTGFAASAGGIGLVLIRLARRRPAA